MRGISDTPGGLIRRAVADIFQSYLYCAAKIGQRKFGFGAPKKTNSTGAAECASYIWYGTTELTAIIFHFAKKAIVRYYGTPYRTPYHTADGQGELNLPPVCVVFQRT